MWVAGPEIIQYFSPGSLLFVGRDSGYARLELQILLSNSKSAIRAVSSLPARGGWPPARLRASLTRYGGRVGRCLPTRIFSLPTHLPTRPRSADASRVHPPLAGRDGRAAPARLDLRIQLSNSPRILRISSASIQA